MIKEDLLEKRSLSNLSLSDDDVDWFVTFLCSGAEKVARAASLGWFFQTHKRGSLCGWGEAHELEFVLLPPRPAEMGRTRGLSCFPARAMLVLHRESHCSVKGIRMVKQIPRQREFTYFEYDDVDRVPMAERCLIGFGPAPVEGLWIDLNSDVIVGKP